MRTFSHALMTAAVGNKFDLPRSHWLAFLTGSVLPDIPLYILTGITMLLSPSWDIGMERMHANYENNVLWISLHNSFHSLIVLAILVLIGVFARKKIWAQALLWFSAAASFHTIIDIFTHAGDGPLFLFPLSWTIRFDSPVSYWDPLYYGKPFSVLEYLLDAVLIVFLIFRFLKRRKV